MMFVQFESKSTWSGRSVYRLVRRQLEKTNARRFIWRVNLIADADAICVCFGRYDLAVSVHVHAFAEHNVIYQSLPLCNHIIDAFHDPCNVICFHSNEAMPRIAKNLLLLFDPSVSWNLWCIFAWLPVIVAIWTFVIGENMESIQLLNKVFKHNIKRTQWIIIETSIVIKWMRP